MLVDDLLGTGVLDTLNHGGVVGSIGENDTVGQLRAQNGKSSVIGGVARSKDEGSILAMKLSNGLLDGLDVSIVAGNVTCTTSASAVLVQGFLHSLENSGVAAHVLVVIGAPNSDLVGLGRQMTLGSISGETIDVVEVAVRLVGVLGLELIVVEALIMEARPFEGFRVRVNTKTGARSADLLLDALSTLRLGERVGGRSGSGSLSELTGMRTFVDVGLVGEADAFLGVKTLNVVRLSNGSTSSLGSRDVGSDLLSSATVHLVREGATSSGGGRLGGVGEERATGSAKGGHKSVGSSTAGLLSLDGEALAHNRALLSLVNKTSRSTRVHDGGRHLTKLRHRDSTHVRASLLNLPERAGEASIHDGDGERSVG